MTPSSLHQQAIQQRESGESRPALRNYQDALLSYAQDENWEGVIRVHLERALVYQHLALNMNKEWTLACQTAEVQIAHDLMRHHQLEKVLGSVVFRELAKLAGQQHKYEEASEYYLEALAHVATRGALTGEILTHLAVAQWHLGQRGQAQQTWQEGLALLQDHHDVDENTRRAWQCGALMNWAVCQAEIDPAAARQLMTQAENVLTPDPIFNMRRQQIAARKAELFT